MVGQRGRATTARRSCWPRSPTGAPSTARDLDDGAPRDKEHWGWNWSEAKKALDYLYMAGELAIAGRNSQFEVSYDLPERVHPADVLAAADADARGSRPRAGAARRGVARRGHGSAACADYYRMRRDAGTRRSSTTLVEEGELLPVAIEGWNRPAYLHRDARAAAQGRRREPCSSPFDPVVWQRERTERLFDFHYRIEIYTPADKRVYGYYVLPFLLRRRDRRPGRPQGRPQGGAPGREVGLGRGRRARGHRRMSSRGARRAGRPGSRLDSVRIEPRGDLAPQLGG